jgi:hypothetical protein
LHGRKGALAGQHVQAQNFSRLTFNHNLHRPAADLTVRGESLEGHGRIHNQFKNLSAIWALDGFRDFHGDNLTAIVVPAKWLNLKATAEAGLIVPVGKELF